MTKVWFAARLTQKVYSSIHFFSLSLLKPITQATSNIHRLFKLIQKHRGSLPNSQHTRILTITNDTVGEPSISREPPVPAETSAQTLRDQLEEQLPSDSSEPTSTSEPSIVYIASLPHEISEPSPPHVKPVYDPKDQSSRMHRVSLYYNHSMRSCIDCSGA